MHGIASDSFLLNLEMDASWGYHTYGLLKQRHYMIINDSL